MADETKPTNTSVALQKMDETLTALSGDQHATKEKLATLEAEHGDVAARLLAADESLKGLSATVKVLEERLTKTRFDMGGRVDHLKNALPDDLKKWIPRVEMEAFNPLESAFESKGLQKMAAKDPVGMVAVAGWFQAKLKAQLSARKGKTVEAQSWSDRAAKLFEALEGGPEAVDARTKVALQEGTATEGGDLVPTITEAMLGALLKEFSVVRASGPTMIQMTSVTHLLPRFTTDFSVYWPAEEAAVSDAVTSAPFNKSTLTASKQGAFVTVSIELIQDNIVNLLNFIFNHLVQMMGREEDAQALEGTGSPFTGLFSVSGTNSLNNDGKASDAGVTITLASYLAMMYKGEYLSTMDGAVVYCHPWVIRDLLLTTISGGSMPVLPFLGANTAKPTNILGETVYRTSVISRVRGATQTNETTAYHGVPRYMIFGDRMATTFDINPWSTTEFKQGQVLLRILRRVGIVVWVPAYFTKLLNIEVT